MLNKWKSEASGMSVPLVNYSNGEASPTKKPLYFDQRPKSRSLNCKNRDTDESKLRRSVDASMSDARERFKELQSRSSMEDTEHDELKAESTWLDATVTLKEIRRRRDNQNKTPLSAKQVPTNSENEMNFETTRSNSSTVTQNGWHNDINTNTDFARQKDTENRSYKEHTHEENLVKEHNAHVSRQPANKSTVLNEQHRQIQSVKENNSSFSNVQQTKLQIKDSFIDYASFSQDHISETDEFENDDEEKYEEEEEEIDLPTVRESDTAIQCTRTQTSSDVLQMQKVFQYLNTQEERVAVQERNLHIGSARTSPGRNSETEIAQRMRNKFEQLERSCLERYQAREDKVVKTLNFCMTALEQLRSWAVFAIFPTDENQKEKYVQFVQQRYQCVIEPLRLFLYAVQRCKVRSEPVISHQSTSRDVNNEKEAPGARKSPGDLRKHRLGGLGGDISIQRGNRFKNTPESPRLGHPMKPPPLDLPNEDYTDQNNDETTTTERSNEASGSLREDINRISMEHGEEGRLIKQAVMDKLQKCQRDTKTLYKWGNTSLLELEDILDEALADELYFMVRSKMTRILATISVFEEAADQIERTLSNHFQATGNGSVSERGTSSTGKGRRTTPPPSPLMRENSADLSHTVAAMKSPRIAERLGPTDGASSASNSGRFEDINDLDLRIEIPTRDSPTGSEGNELEDLLLAWSYNGGGAGHVRFAANHVEIKPEVERQSEASTPRSSSTPEPPLSPRPRALVKHPKIMKDKLNSMALPSKFSGMSSGRFSASF